MLLGIDHVVIAVPDLAAAAHELEESVGIAATGDGRHAALGTANRLAWLGDTYVELVTVEEDAIAANSWLGGPVMDALADGGGFVTWAIASDDLDGDVASFGTLGADYGDPFDGERRRADGEVVRWRLAIPNRLGPAEPPFLIEHDPASAEWQPADRSARKAQLHPIGGPDGAIGPVRLDVLELPTESVPATIQRLTRALGLRFRPSLSGGGARDANIGTQTVRLRPSRGKSAVPSIHLASPAAIDRAVEVFGCRWVLRPSR
ncbi:MAG TPA: VOC family protein [Candidatus Limnocylindrales bacterium]|nr:VOC family protein [Candidatus Limnocylindrales bacterium]